MGFLVGSLGLAVAVAVDCKIEVGNTQEMFDWQLDNLAGCKEHIEPEDYWLWEGEEAGPVLG